MKLCNPSLPLLLLAGAYVSGCGGATEINYVGESGGTAGDGGSAGLGGVSGSGGSSDGGAGVGGSTSTGGTAGNGGSSSSSTGGTAGDGGSSSSSTGGTAGDGGSNTGGAGGVSTNTGGAGASSVDSGGATTGGAGGTAGAGGSGGDPGCLATGCPAGQYCDGDTRMCNPLKAPGEACERSQQCEDLLDCLDGVCCNDDECPACQNCGSDGECSIIVQDAEDPTGTECTDSNSCDAAGACKLVLGESCGVDEQCVSGSCLDGVCCGETSCPECYNCGADGACSVAVQGADDMTSQCNGISTCDGRGECTSRWSLVATLSVSGPYELNYSTSVGSTFYFADDGGYHIGYDISSGVTSDAPLNDDYCRCGYGGTAVSDGTSIFYFGNDGRMWTPGEDSWVDVAGYMDANIRDGEGTFAVTDGRVYRAGGRENEDRLSYYDIANGTFVTDNLPEHPVGGVAYGACSGAVNGKVYLFGWDDGGFTEYDPNDNLWTEVESDDNAPSYCYQLTVPAWGQYLVHADYADLKLLNTALLQWEPEGIPLPDTTNLTLHIPMIVGDQLYVAGFESGNEEIHIYQYMLSGPGSGL